MASQNKLDVWGPRLGDNGTRNIILPQVLPDNRIELENTQIQLIGSAAAPERTFAWVESIKAVIGGINIFGTGLHLWMADSATDKDKQKWLQVLHTIADLNPEIVIPHIREITRN